MRRTAVRVGGDAVRKAELSPEERAIVSKFPPASALKTDPDDIRTLAHRLMSKPEQAHLEKAYREAAEFGDYWAEVYKGLRLSGIRALENYCEGADFGEVDSTLEALDAILSALRSDIARSRRDQRAMELKYGLQARSDKPAAFTQMGLF